MCVYVYICMYVYVCEYIYICVYSLVLFSWVLWHINHCRLFNSKTAGYLIPVTIQSKIEHLFTHS